MDLPNITDLGKVIDLCRKKGVKTFQIGELKFELGEEPEKKIRKVVTDDEAVEVDPTDPWANFPTGTLTGEQLAFYSAGGVPGQEPWLNKGEAE